MKTSRLRWLLAVCTGILFAAESPPPPADALPSTVITSVRLRIPKNETEVRAIFDDTVKLVGNGITITCDHLEVVRIPPGDNSVILVQDQYKSIVATGHVNITMGDRLATCGRAEIFPAEDKLVLTDDPVVIDRAQSSSISGTEMTLHRGSNEIEVTNSKSIVPGMKDFGPGKNKPAAPQPAPAPAK